MPTKPRRLVVAFAIVAGCILPVAVPAQPAPASQDSPSLFVPLDESGRERGAAALLPELALTQGLFRSRRAVLDVDVFHRTVAALAAPGSPASVAGSTRLVLDVFEDARIEVVVDSVVASSIADGYVLSATPADGLGSAVFAVHFDDAGGVAAVAGTVTVPAGVFSISLEDGGVLRIDEVDTSVPWTDEVLDAPPDAPASRLDPELGVARATVSTPIDILVVYTPAVEAGLGSSAMVEAQVDSFVAKTNRAFATAGAAAGLTVVGVRRLEFQETGNQAADLRTFAVDPLAPAARVLHAWRESESADLVHVLGDYPDSSGGIVCGIAYNALGFAFGFAITNVGDARCLAYTFSHEVGHNLGLSHDRHTQEADGRSFGFPPYAHGFSAHREFLAGETTTCWYTIMAYDRHCVGIRGGSRVHPIFSDPDTVVEGVPAGVPGEIETGTVDGPAHAARALRENWPVVAGYRTRGSGPDPDGNQPPRITKVLDDLDLSPRATVTIELADVFEDPDEDDTLVHTVVSSSPSIARVTRAGTVLTVTAGTSFGSALITVVATDPGGLSASQTFRVSVMRSNGAPRAVPVGAQEIVPGSDLSLDLSTAFTDPEGDSLVYMAVSSDRTVVAVWLNAGVLTLTAESEGTATVAVTARDPGGLQATQDIPVRVRFPPNQPPEVVAPFGRRIVGVGDDPLSVDVSGVFRDPEGALLTYGLSVGSPDVVQVGFDEDRLVLTIEALRPGVSLVTLLARDPDGATTPALLRLRVTAPFTDPQIIPGRTPVRAVHWTQLRGRVAAIRRDAGLPPVGWTDRSLVPGGTTIRAAHVRELRSALLAVYGAAGLPTPSLTDSVIVVGVTPLKAVHVMEMRAAVRALEKLVW